MSSRRAQSSRSRHPEPEASKPTLMPTPSKRNSVISTTSSTSKLPIYTSFFSRHRHAKNATEDEKRKKTSSSNKPKPDVPRSREALSSKNDPVANKSSRAPPNDGLGIVSARGEITTDLIKPNKLQRNALRHRAPSIGQRSQYAPTESSASSYDPKPLFETSSSSGHFAHPSSAGVFGVPLPSSTSPTPYGSAFGPLHAAPLATSNSRMATYNAQKIPQSISTSNLPPPTPNFAHSSESSTRRSESPGSFSRTSTPTSMSSQSPGMSLQAKSPLRPRQISPARSRPPVTKWRIGGGTRQEELDTSQPRGLAPVRESGTSSSSSSTVKGIDNGQGSGPKKIPPKLPIPSSRGSSQEGSREPVRYASPGQQALTRTQPALGYSGAPETRLRRGSHVIDHVAEPDSSNLDFPYPVPSRTPPARPSREGTPRLENATEPTPVVLSNLSRLVTTGHKVLEAFLRPRIHPFLEDHLQVRRQSTRSHLDCRPPTPMLPVLHGQLTLPSREPKNYPATMWKNGLHK